MDGPGIYEFMTNIQHAFLTSKTTVQTYIIMTNVRELIFATYLSD